MSKIIWESETEQGVICESHIVAITTVIGYMHPYEMYDLDCKTYQLSEQDFEQIAAQIDYDEFILLEAAGVKIWLNKENFTDAICNQEICEIGGWRAHPLIFAELIKYFKGRKERKLAKKIARQNEKAMLKTPEGIEKLMANLKTKFSEKIMELQKEHDFLTKTPAVMV